MRQRTPHLLLPVVTTIGICALLMASSTVLWAQNQRWEIVPQADSRIKAGKLSVVGGMTSEEGVRFVINNVDVAQPIEIALAAERADKPLMLTIYKDSPDQGLLQRATGAEGLTVAKFRTDSSVQLIVKGATGAKYQLMTWVGPKLDVPTPSAFVPIDARGTPLVEGVTLTPAAASEKPQERTATLAVPRSVMILLALILAALVVLIVVLVRRGGGGGKAASAAILLAILLGTLSNRARAQQPASMDLAPKTVKPEDVWKSLNETLDKVRERLESLEKGGIKAEPEAIKLPKPGSTGEGGGGEAKINPGKLAGQFVTSTKLLLDFLEEFGLIDPREAAVQPNYNPPGQPLIPSRCVGTGECGACFKDANAKLDKSRKLLEDMYVIYKQTELKAGRIHEMANAAAGLSPYAQLAWTAAKNNPNEPMNVAQKHFYEVYDTNLAKLLQMANEGLIGVSACEREHFKDYDWYPRYGMIYYNFLRERYTRK